MIDPGENLRNCVKAVRLARGWSQEDLARRSGLSRSGISAIEIERLIPSAAAALALAAALGLRVEDLFHLGQGDEICWAREPTTVPSRYWQARIAGRRVLYPAACLGASVLPHDGVWDGKTLSPATDDLSDSTLVMGTCDPAAGLLADELIRKHGVRLLVIPASSRRALELVKLRLVHVAGVHLSAARDDGNANAVQGQLGEGYQLLRIARWQEGLAVQPARRIKSLRSALQAQHRWVGRESGSGARQCFDEIRGNRKPPRREAHSHQGVTEAIRSGFADVGVCVELVSSQAGLDFLPIREEAYDVCFSRHDSSDPRIIALVEAAQSLTYRKLLADLPGYNSTDTGQIQSVG